MALPVFNGFSLQDDNYITTDVEYRTWPKRELAMEKIALRAGSKLLNAEFAERNISIRGFILGSSVSDLQSKIDSLYTLVKAEAKSLQMETDRFFTATVASLSIADPHYNQSMVPFEMNFVCPDPFSYGTAVSAQMTVASGTLTQTFNVTISGTYGAEPSLAYSAPSGSGNTTTSGIQVQHLATGEYVLWQNDADPTYVQYGTDVTFDYQNYKVLVDTTQKTHSGIFSLIDPGLNSFQITFMGYPVGGTITVTYAPRYL